MGVVGPVIRLLVSLLVSVAALAAITYIFPPFGPDLTLDFFDMLASLSPSAWLLLALATAIVYAALSRLTIRRRIGDADRAGQNRETEQSD